MEPFLHNYRLTDAAKDALRGEVLDQLYQGVVVTDPSLPDNPIIYANQAFLDLTGYAHEEIVGFNCRFLQGPGTDPRTVDRLREALRNNSPFFGEILNYTRDGRPFWNALSIKPLCNEDGSLRHFVASQTDVTLLKQLELRSQEQQRMELLGSFAGNIAHDFNNVLLATGGYANLLEQKLDEGSEVRGFAERIVGAADSGRRLTQRLVAFSKGGRGEELGRVDVGHVAAETVAMTEMMMPSAVQVSLNLPTGLPHVLATRTQIEQIVLNLVVNARDAIDGPGSISVSVAHAGDRLMLDVTDTGSGMSDDVREKIFESFFTTKEQGKGTGLGLATVNTIVAELGGTIDVASRLGFGTTFSVHLPIAG